MANKRIQVIINLRIEAMYDHSKCSDPEQTAIDLALNPNYHTIENGVQLTSTDYVILEDDPDWPESQIADSMTD